MDARVVSVVEFGGIETEQDVDLITRPILRLIDFVILYECFRKMAHRREARIFVHDRRVERGLWMLVEPAADHLPVFRPLVVGVKCGVNPDKSFSVIFDEGHQILLLTVVQIELAGRADEC